jgi:fatty-acyl-CoA synthase
MPLRFATAQVDTRPLLIRQILEGALVTAAGQAIIYREGHRQTYAHLGARVHRLASMLESVGVVPGTTVAFMDWDSHRYLEAYFAIPMMGAVLQTVNPRLSPGQITYCLDSSAAAVLVFHRDFAELVSRIKPALAKIKCTIIISDGQPVASMHGAHLYEVAMSRAADRYPFTEFDENALATTFHTTGTTGAPKAVSFSHRQLVLHTLALMATLGNQPPGEGFRRGDVYMPLTPMFHVHAWGLPYVATLAGAKQVYPGRYEPSLLVRLIREERVTFSHCVPTVLQMVLEAAEAAGNPWLGPCTILVGGSPLTQALQSAATRAGVTTVVGYGMSETAPVISISRSSVAGAIDDTRKAGYPLPLVETAIVDDSMNKQPVDGMAKGELVLRAPWLTRSYEGDPDASKELWRGGWMHTQDIASIALDGCITIRDRLKDVIKTGGEWISSAQIEDLLQQHAQVREAAVIAVADRKWGERPLAFVVLWQSDGGADLGERLCQHLDAFVANGTISRFAIPTRVMAIDALPRTSVGKIDKKHLRELHARSSTSMDL